MWDKLKEERGEGGSARRNITSARGASLRSGSCWNLPEWTSKGSRCSKTFFCTLPSRWRPAVKYIHISNFPKSRSRKVEKFVRVLVEIASSSPESTSADVLQGLRRRTRCLLRFKFG